jgi:hypothetical protein
VFQSETLSAGNARPMMVSLRTDWAKFSHSLPYLYHNETWKARRLRLQWFKVAKGYGFIQPDGGGDFLKSGANHMPVGVLDVLSAPVMGRVSTALYRAGRGAVEAVALTRAYFSLCQFGHLNLIQLRKLPLERSDSFLKIISAGCQRPGEHRILYLGAVEYAGLFLFSGDIAVENLHDASDVGNQFSCLQGFPCWGRAPKMTLMFHCIAPK